LVYSLINAEYSTSRRVCQVSKEWLGSLTVLGWHWQGHAQDTCGVILARSLALGMKPTMRSIGCPSLNMIRVGMLITP
jgi:hypothetical protein